nr:hypothetical protein [Salmonid herpesvirus 1]
MALVDKTRGEVAFWTKKIDQLKAKTTKIPKIPTVKVSFQLHLSVVHFQGTPWGLLHVDSQNRAHYPSCYPIPTMDPPIRGTCVFCNGIFTDLGSHLLSELRDNYLLCVGSDTHWELTSDPGIRSTLDLLPPNNHTRITIERLRANNPREEFTSAFEHTVAFEKSCKNVLSVCKKITDSQFI